MMTDRENDDKQSPNAQGNASPNAHEAKQRQRVLGERLREMFEDVVNEPVPDEFLKLLEQADEKSAGDDDTSE